MTALGSLFSGYGGLDLAVEQVFAADTVWHCEIEPAPSKVLAARWPAVPNLRDVTAVDWSAVEPVDVICGGSPCQDVSSAGKRAGMRAGTRSGLWASMCDAIDVLRPRFVVWENVRGVTSACADSELGQCPRCVGDESQPHRPVLRALGRVLGDLADLGYDAAWTGVRAADVGAPHGRYRIFVVALNANGGHRRASWSRKDQARSTVLPQRGSDTAGQSASDAPHVGHKRGWHTRDGRSRPADGGRSAPDTDRASGETLSGRPGRGHARRLQPLDSRGTDWGQYAAAIHRWEHLLRRVAPAPTEAGPTGAQRLSPRFVEWMMGLPAGWVTDVPGISRNEQLKMLGNGVVPRQAAHALQLLLSHVETERAA